MTLSGRRALITGANQGFGLAVAGAFVKEGADVLLCARDEGKLNLAREEVMQYASNGQRVLAIQADVSSPTDVARVVKTSLADLGGLEILVSNAGIYGPKGPSQGVAWSEWVDAIEINLMGTVLMCREVLPTFIEKGYGKIVLLSGGGATKPLPFLSAYAASKAAVVRFGETVAEEVRGQGIDINSVAPGALNTRLLDEILEAGPERVGTAFYNQALKQQKEGGTPLEQGAALCVFLASTASDGITGKLISAVWDPWESLQDHRHDLDRSDVYTLRRIVPGDRGQDWG